MAGHLSGESLDPSRRADQLNDLPEGCEHAQNKNKEDEAVEPRVRLEHRQNARKRNKRAQPGQAQNDKHEQDLAVGI